MSRPEGIAMPRLSGPTTGHRPVHFVRFQLPSSGRHVELYLLLLKTAHCLEATQRHKQQQQQRQQPRPKQQWQQWSL
jgi:hypothetical protein